MAMIVRLTGVSSRMSRLKAVMRRLRDWLTKAVRSVGGSKCSRSEGEMVVAETNSRKAAA